MRCHSRPGLFFATDSFRGERLLLADSLLVISPRRGLVLSLKTVRLAPSRRPDRGKKCSFADKGKKNQRTCCESVCHSACHVKSSHFNAHCKHRRLKKRTKKKICDILQHPSRNSIRIFPFFLFPQNENLKLMLWECELVA